MLGRRSRRQIKFSFDDRARSGSASERRQRAEPRIRGCVSGLAAAWCASTLLCSCTAALVHRRSATLSPPAVGITVLDRRRDVLKYMELCWRGAAVRWGPRSACRACLSAGRAGGGAGRGGGPGGGRGGGGGRLRCISGRVLCRLRHSVCCSEHDHQHDEHDDDCAANADANRPHPQPLSPANWRPLGCRLPLVRIHEMAWHSVHCRVGGLLG